MKPINIPGPGGPGFPSIFNLERLSDGVWLRDDLADLAYPDDVFVFNKYTEPAQIGFNGFGSFGDKFAKQAGIISARIKTV